MKRLMLAAVAITLIGCTNKECEPTVKYVEQKFPVMETVELNTTIKIPSYKIEREKISVVNDVNVTMSVDTLRKSKDGDALKVKYLLHRLKLFMFGLGVMNDQAKKYNKEFANEQNRSN